MAIVTRLGRGPASVSELAEPFAMSLTGFLKHLRVLEDAGVVVTTKHGRVRHCELNGTRLDEASAWLDQCRARWEGRLDRMERYTRRRGE